MMKGEVAKTPGNFGRYDKNYVSPRGTPVPETVFLKCQMYNASKGAGMG
jgi:hypothetical protein